MLNYAAKVISILLAEKYEYSIQSSVVRSKVVSLQNRHEHSGPNRAGSVYLGVVEACSRTPMSQSVSPRRSQRATQGVRPARYRSLSGNDDTSLDEATRKRRIAQAELKAAEEVTRLKREELKLDMELAKKRLALEQAQVDEELAITASGGSSETLHRPELRLAMSDSGVGVRRKKKKVSIRRLLSDTELLVAPRGCRGNPADSQLTGRTRSGSGSSGRNGSAEVVLSSSSETETEESDEDHTDSSESESGATMRRVIHGAQGPVANPSPAVNAPIDPVSVAFAVNAGGQAVVRRPRSASGPSSTSAGSSNRKPVMLSSVASGTSTAPIQSSVSSGGTQAAQLGSAVPASTKGSVAVPVRKLLKVKRAPVSSVVPPELETLPEAPAPTALNATSAPFQPSRPWQNSTWDTTPLVALPAHRVKPLELPKFSGLEKDFLRWRQHFHRIVDDDPHTAEVYKLAQLRQCLQGGQAEELVEGILDGPGAYQAVLDELDKWYGGDDQALERQEKELLQWPRMKDTEAVTKFAIKLRTTLVNMGVCGVEPGRELYLSVTQKLPRSVLLDFFKNHDDRECDIHVFSEWLMNRVHMQRRVDERLKSGERDQLPSAARSSALPAWTKARAPSQPRTFVTSSGRSDGTTTRSSSSVSCPQCTKQHQLVACPDFGKLPVYQRWKVLKAAPEVCAVCLRHGHRSGRCGSPRCAKCDKLHHALLHFDRTSTRSTAAQGVKQESSEPASTAATYTACTGETEATSEAFMLVPVILLNGGVRVRGTALLDPASSTSYVRQSIATALNVNGARERLTTSVLGGEQTSAIREHVKLEVEVSSGGTSQFGAWVLPNVTGAIPHVDWNDEKAVWPHLQNIVFPDVNDSRVDVLIGLNAIDLHASLEERRSDTAGAPIARRTPLGWACFGPTSALSMDKTAENTLSITAAAGSTEPRLEQLVEKFWSDESAGVDDTSRTKETPSADDLEAERITANNIRLDDGRVMVSIPWVDQSGLSRVSSNRAQAEQRLVSLERSLGRRPVIRDEYIKVMAGHVKKGYVRQVSPEELQLDGDNQWYLPHFPVVREDKATTKVRIVFDAAAIWDGRSLNDMMFSGPALQNDMVGILLRFCEEPVALVGDISEMFLQVRLKERDQRFHRFLWRGDDGNVVVYQFQRLVFGAKASPYLASRAIKEVAAQQEGNFSTDVLCNLSDNLYVDDLLSSLATPEKAIETRQKTQDLLSERGFHMRKWLSNSSSVMDSIPKEDQAPEMSKAVGDGGPNQLPTVKTLGITWKAETDVFTFQCKPAKIIKFTRRSVLRGLATIYDPRGLIAPYLIRAKVMLQDAWLLDGGWDDELPAEHVVKWQAWFQGLPQLSNLNIDRCFKDPKKPSSEASLSIHCFTDASDRAVAASVYVRAEYPDGTVRTTLAFSKAKPAPVRRHTIPSLELRAAVLGVRISSLVGEALRIPVSQHTFWTDSMNVLGWVQAHSRRFKVDVGNRISEIQNATKPAQWRHVSGKDNPADAATRGLSVSALCNHETWWSGPLYLRKPQDAWPSKKVVDTTQLPGQLKPKPKSTFVTISADEFDLQLERFDTWERLVRTTAWCTRFIRNCQQAVRARQAKKGDANQPAAQQHLATKQSQSAEVTKVSISAVLKDSPPQSLLVEDISVKEFTAAERYWIAAAQRSAYAATFSQLKSQQPVSASDPLVGLSPQLDAADEPAVIIVGGRLSSAKNLPNRIRHPVILPPKHRVTRLLVQHEDRQCKHAAGHQHLLANLRQRYWIVNGASVIRSVIHECVTCRRNRTTPAKQMMGPLPDYRVAQSLQPFTRVGVDYAGPFQTKQGRGRVRAKRYLCLFTCLEIRACHLEVAHSLSTESFLMALQRFIKRRGVPKVMVSDNGTNFRAADQELKAAVSDLDRQKIVRHLVDQRIVWKFNPPRAPHFGGVFEALIKSAKRALSAVLSQAEVSDEELTTAVCAVEDLLNSRPLGLVSTDPNDLSPLTPRHFLVGRMDGPLPVEIAGSNPNSPVDPRKRWLYVQRLVADVWKRWLLELVPLLNVRKKWQKSGRNVAVDDIVMSLVATTPRGTWPLGRVVKVYPGADKLVRVVDVLIDGKVYRRAVHQLVPLLEAGE